MLDTSVVVDLNVIDSEALPKESCIATISLAELTVGILSAKDFEERSKRLQVLLYIESTLEVISFDSAAARAYGRIYSAATSAGIKPRGGRAVDFLIAATALSRALPFYTRNFTDFASLTSIVRIVAV